MYFKHENGSFKRVPIYPNAQLGTRIKQSRKRVNHVLIFSGYEGQDTADINGGMTIYYTQKDFNSPDLENHITAFPPGFRMTVGSPANSLLNGTRNGLAYTCLQTVLTRGSETLDFPTKPCPAGIMGTTPHPHRFMNLY